MAMRLAALALIGTILGPWTARAGADFAPTPDAGAGLVVHTPAADVAYRPGVDVEGHPVAPADLEGQTALDLSDQYDMNVFARLDEVIEVVPGLSLIGQSEITLGTVMVADDAVSFNGQALTPDS